MLGKHVQEVLGACNIEGGGGGATPVETWPTLSFNRMPLIYITGTETTPLAYIINGVSEYLQKNISLLDNSQGTEILDSH